MAKWIKLNSIVSYYSKPVYGSVKSKRRVMALSVDKEGKGKLKGVVRVITSSKGNVDIPGFVDKSKLIIVESRDGLKWKKVKDLKIKGMDEVVKKLSSKDKYFIGLEDSDIITKNGIKHLYFTIAFKFRRKYGHEVYLGHAFGSDLENLEATMPVLSPIGKKIRGFKEVSIGPKGINLTEMQIHIGKKDFSAIGAVKNNGGVWKYLDIVLDPRKLKYSWCKGETSPCVLLNIKKENLVVGIINGREVEKKINGKRIYGKFRPGLILFNPKTGKIPWVSKIPLLEDPDATTITFASDFMKINKNKGILYAHVNDSFIRAYEIKLDELRKFLN